MPAAASVLPFVQPLVGGLAAPASPPAPCPPAPSPVAFPILPRETAPQMVQAIGARCWSTDGAEYIDFDNAHGAVLLGHRHPDVINAIRAARDAWPAAEADRIRDEVEARILDTARWAQAAVFGADVSQAMRAAMTCARFATGRRQVLACRSSVWRSGAQTASFPFDDLPALERLMDDHGGEVAAVVLSPSEALQPSPGYLAGVRTLLDRHGALLIYDESLSGFRVHEGGAQALFGVAADLAVYGESLSNGLPLGALIGPRAVIEAAGTHVAGELRADMASLAAARAVLTKIDAEPVLTALRIAGAEVQAELMVRLDAAGIGDRVRVFGDPAASRIGFCPPAGLDALPLKSLWVGECLAHSLFSLGELNISYAHGEPEIAVLLRACDQAADRLAAALSPGQLPRHMGSDTFQRLMVQ